MAGRRFVEAEPLTAETRFQAQFRVWMGLLILFLVAFVTLANVLVVLAINVVAPHVRPIVADAGLRME